MKLGLKDLDVANKTVLIRVDFNVPLDKDATITDDTRILKALPTIEYVLSKGGAVILMSHLGRPNGEKNSKYSLYPCAKHLAKLIGRPVQMAPDCVGGSVMQMVRRLQPGQVLLLENLRFHDAEEHPDKDPSFAQQLAELGDCFVNDAFGTAHRAHSSNVAITKYFPGKSAAGLLLQKEMEFLGEALLNPKRPFYALIGGAKISTKIGVLEALKDKVDGVLIGGGMSYTFFKANGFSIGNSIHEDAFLEKAKEIQEAYSKAKIPFLLPQDLVVTENFSAEGAIRIVTPEGGIPSGFEGVDIGPKTVEHYISTLQKVSTLFWNGPVGVFEVEPFAKGTNALAQAIAKLDAVTVVGGGDSVAAIQSLGLSEKISHISTGGGASLEFIEKGSLPAIEALSDAK